MATVYSGEYWTGSWTYTRVRVDYSGTTATATLLYTRTNTYGGATGAGNPAYFYFGKQSSYGTADISNKTFYGQQTDAVVGSCTFTISQAGGTYSGYTSLGGYVGGDTSWSSPAWSVNIPSQYTKPTKPTNSASVQGNSQIDITYGTTSFGNPSSGTVYLYGGTSSAPTTQIDSKTTTGNSTYSHTGLTPNAIYYYRARANNGQLNSDYSTEISAITLPAVATTSLRKATSNSLQINYSYPADGEYYSSKTIEYSIDGGTTWNTGYSWNISGAISGFFTISGLSANTQYTVKTRITTTAGSTNNADLIVSTIGPETPTLSLSRQSPTSILATYGTTSYGGGTDPHIFLFRGTSADPTNVVDENNVTGNIQYTDTGLTTNTRYYYRTRARATFDGTVVFSEYKTANLLLPATMPTVSNVHWGTYSSVNTGVVMMTVSVPSEGSSASRRVQIRYSLDNGGSWSSWSTRNTYSDGSAHSATVLVTNLPTSTTVYFEVRDYTGISTAYVNSFTFTTPAQHQGPTGVDFNLSENNSSVKSWLSGFSGYVDGGFYIGNQSQIRVTIPQASVGTPQDNASLSYYDTRLIIDTTPLPSPTSSITINYASGQDLVGDFASGQPTSYPYTTNAFLNYKVRMLATDSLDTYTTIDKSTKASRWFTPTITVSGTRLSTAGNVLIEASGTYARLNFGSSLNNGNDCNTISLSYRVLDSDDTVLVDWTALPSPTTEVGERADENNFNIRTTLTGIQSVNSFKVEVKAQDHFSSSSAEVLFEVWDPNQTIYPAQYDIEVWDWRTNTFIADISDLIIGELNIEWTLNDVEDVSFNIDLLRFEKKCKDTGVTPGDLLIPYKHDLRIRRNGEYILGVQVVEANVQLKNQPPATIQVKGTGFLNLLKDQYVLRQTWSGYTYAQIAQKLIELAQRPDCLIQNPSIDIDTSYWLGNNASIATSSSVKKAGDNSLVATNASASASVVVGTQMDAEAGTTINASVWVRAASGHTIAVQERRYISEYSDAIAVQSVTSTGDWQEITISNYTLSYDNSYFCIRCDGVNPLFVDECYIWDANYDVASLCNLGITLGTDTASATQDPTRQVDYQLQNVKDALIDLTNMEEDNFDFEFLPDRTFNIYDRKGADKLDLEVAYPGNVESMTINRSASNLANKVIGIGSGIGDERLQTIISNTPSRQDYGTHETIMNTSNISLLQTLRDKAVGELYDRKEPTNLPRVRIRDGSVNPSNVETGDTLLVTVEDNSYLRDINGEYRLMKIKFTFEEDGVESMDLTFDTPTVRPEKKMIRYIRDTVLGSDINYSAHWVEVQALMLVGNEYVNVALGKTVYGSTSFAGTATGDKAVDDDYTTYAGISGSDNSRKGITIDLGDEYPIDYIKVYHYSLDGRSYYGAQLSVGTELVGGTSGTAALSDVLWSYGDNEKYKESSVGKKSKWLQEQNIVEGS